MPSARRWCQRAAAGLACGLVAAATCLTAWGEGSLSLSARDLPASAAAAPLAPEGPRPSSTTAPRPPARHERAAASAAPPGDAEAQHGSSQLGATGAVRNTTDAPAQPAVPAWRSYVHRDGENPLVAGASAEGLPEDSQGGRPGWLVGDDTLIVDARAQRGDGSGGILVVSAVLLDSKKHTWGARAGGKEAGEMRRPKWFRSCLAATRSRLRRFGHAMVVRWKPTLKASERIAHYCAKQEAMKIQEAQQCFRDHETIIFNWEKELMLLEYLSSPENFAYVLMLDADAALVHAEHDTLSLMALELRAAGKVMFLSNEDWSKGGKRVINGGLIFVANVVWTRQFFQDMLGAYMKGTVQGLKSVGGGSLTCTSNEQACLLGMAKRPGFQERVAVFSGQRWNRGGCVFGTCEQFGGPANTEMGRLGMTDPSMEIMHFSGGSKNWASKVLCNASLNVSREPIDGYGCSGK